MDLKLSIGKLYQGDEEELKHFYLLYFPHFLSFALQYVSEEDQCRDIVQDVFINYWEKHADFTDIISLKVFFYRSIRNRCLNEIRNQQLRQPVEVKEISELFSENTLEENVIREEVAILVRQQIAKLNKQEQKVLRLSLQGHTNQEIAEILSLSINTVKTHKLRAYTSLRLQLQDLHTLLNLLIIP